MPTMLLLLCGATRQYTSFATVTLAFNVPSLTCATGCRVCFVLCALVETKLPSEQYQLHAS